MKKTKMNYKKGGKVKKGYHMMPDGKMMKGYHKTKKGTMAKKGLWYNIQQKKKRIAAGSGEKMRKPGTKGAPTAKAIKRSQGKK